MIRRALLPVFLWLLACEPSRAQTEFVFSGYVLELAFGQRSNESIALLTGSARNAFLNVSRMRLRPEVLVGAGGHVFLEYEVSALYHTSPLFLASSVPDRPHQAVDLSWTPRESEHFTLSHFIDRLYYRHTFDDAEISVGRQRVSWGTGRIWNPTDLFNPINPVNIAKVEKDGIDACTGKIFLGEFSDLALVVNPQRKNSANFGGRFRTNMAEFDLSLLGGRFDRRIVAGADFAGNLFDAGVRGEAIVSMQENAMAERYVMAVLGADYQFTAELYGLVEYHFNGRGALRKEAYDILALAQESILNLARNYVALMGSWLAHPLVNVTGTGITNLDDGSAYVSLSANYAASENIGMSIGAQVFIGNPGDEFWYYPAALFLKADVFF